MARRYKQNPGGIVPLLVLGGAGAAVVYMLTRKDAAKTVGGEPAPSMLFDQDAPRIAFREVEAMTVPVGRALAFNSPSGGFWSAYPQSSDLTVIDTRPAKDPTKSTGGLVALSKGKTTLTGRWIDPRTNTEKVGSMTITVA